MMKDLLKKKMQHVINLHIHVGGKGKEDTESQKTSDLAPVVEDKEGSPAEEAGESYGEKLAEGDIAQNAVPMHHGPQAMADEHRMNILDDMGAYAGNQKPKGLRGKAMHAAGLELDKLKAKKKLNKA